MGYLSKRSPTSSGKSAFRSAAPRGSERTVPRTRNPRSSSSRMQCRAMKPEAPVTSPVVRRAFERNPREEPIIHRAGGASGDR